jgi:hypothetical protein
LGEAARASRFASVIESESWTLVSDPARAHWLTGEAVSLPSLSGLSADDEVFLRAMLAFAETGAMFRGRYVEAHVARLLGAVFPSTGVNGWDLMVPGDRPVFVEVKASRWSGSFDVSKLAANRSGGAADVWVFVAFDTPEGERPSGFAYAVAGPSDREQFRSRKRMTVSKVFDQLGPVDAAELLAEVRRLAGA